MIDLDTGYQPVTNETGDVVAVYNGEAYNFRELRDQLRGHEVRGTGDTPVLPHLYEESGPQFVERLQGMFALALWDGPRERLVLARDRLGKKPLLWTRLPDGTLAFASELKALLRLPQVSRDVDVEALDAYLALQYVPGERTGLRGIHKLPPGHVLVAEGDGERIERYWRAEPADASAGEQEWLERVRRTVDEAVRKRLVADVPLGALLSGGIDSSIVVALMAQASVGAGAHVHGRLRGCALRRARLCAARRDAVRNRARRTGDPGGRRGDAPEIGGDVRRAARRRGCVPDLPDRRAGAARMSRSRLRVTVVTNRSRATSAMRRSHWQGAFRRRSRRRALRRCGLCRQRGGSLARRSSVPRAFSTWLRRRRRRVTRG